MMKGQIRFQITQQTGIGETIATDVPSWNPVTGADGYDNVDEMVEAARKALSLTDERVYAMNMRHIEALKFKDYFLPEIWQMVLQLFDVIYGKVQPDLLKARWDSIKEENEGLKQSREEHARLEILKQFEQQGCICDLEFQQGEPQLILNDDCTVHASLAFQKNGALKEAEA